MDTCIFVFDFHFSHVSSTILIEYHGPGRSATSSIGFFCHTSLSSLGCVTWTMLLISGLYWHSLWPCVSIIFKQSIFRPCLWLVISIGMACIMLKIQTSIITCHLTFILAYHLHFVWSSLVHFTFNLIMIFEVLIFL